MNPTKKWGEQKDKQFLLH